MLNYIHTIWIVVTHYSYGVVVEFFADIGDQFVTHYIVVWVIKAGAVSGFVAVVKHIHVRTRKG
jgi:hypothetical protein